MQIQRPTSTLSAAAAAVLLVAGCGSAGPDLAGDVCNKADTCNALSGITAAQCKNVIDTSLAAMPGAARSDAETAYRACLGMADCDTFNACIVRVMQGGSAGTGGAISI